MQEINTEIGFQHGTKRTNGWKITHSVLCVRVLNGICSNNRLNRQNKSLSIYTKSVGVWKVMHKIVYNRYTTAACTNWNIEQLHTTDREQQQFYTHTPLELAATAAAALCNNNKKKHNKRHTSMKMKSQRSARICLQAECAVVRLHVSVFRFYYFPLLLHLRSSQFKLSALTCSYLRRRLVMP